MIFRKFQLAALATALCGAMGVASAQEGSTAAGAGTSAGGSVGMTAAGSKAAASSSGNEALTRETEISGNTVQGSPGTQSGAAVSDTASMGAAGASLSSQSFPSLSRTQMQALQRYNALR